MRELDTFWVEDEDLRFGVKGFRGFGFRDSGLQV